MKKCPSCQSVINSKAIKCPYCLSDQRYWLKWVSVLVTIVLLVSLIIYVSSKFGLTKPESKKSTETQITITIVQATPTLIPTPTTENPKISPYKASIAPIIQKFQEEDAILDADKNDLFVTSDPVHITANKAFTDLQNKMYDMDVNLIPESYKSYNSYLANIIDTMASSFQGIFGPKGTNGSSQINGFTKMGVSTAEEEIKTAAKMVPGDYLDKTKMLIQLQSELIQNPTQVR